MKFYGQTDSEIVANIIADTPGSTLLEKVESALPKLEGAYALLIVSAEDPTEMIAIRYGSPLLLGK